MKSFRKFITEKREEGAFPVSDADKKKLQRQARPETSSLSSERIRRGLDTARKPLSSDEIIGAWKSVKSAKPSVVATSSKPESGVYFGSSKKAIKTAQEQEKRQQVRDTIAKNPTASAELQAAQSSGPKETMVGKGAKSGTGETYRANRPSETQATGVPSKKGRISGSVSKGNIKFSGDTKYKEMLAKMPNAPKKTPRVGAPVATTKVVKQAEVSKEIKKSLASKSAPKVSDMDYETYMRTKSGTPKNFAKMSDTDFNARFGNNPKAQIARDIGKEQLARDIGVKSPREVSKAIGTYNREQQRKYQSAKSDIIARKGFSAVKKGGLSDRIIPGPAGEHAAKVRSGRAAKIGSGVWSSKRGTTDFNTMFKKALKTSKGSPTTIPDPFGGQARASIHRNPIPKKYQVPKTQRPTQRPVNATTHGVDTKGNYLSKDERKRIHSGKPGAIVTYKPPEKPPSKLETGLSNIKKELESTRSQSQSTARNLETSVNKRFSDIKSAKTSARIGAGGLLSALGAAQEYNVGAARAKREGKGKLGQAFRGAARAAGAFVGGVAGTAIGGKVAGSVGAIGGGTLGYSKGADFGSRAAKAVEKSSAGKWLAKTAKKYVPGIA